jgi:hypothetical protein
MARAAFNRSPDHRTPSERELRRIYERGVTADLAAGARPADQPVAMIITGQPGAGLTFATVKLRQRLLDTVSSAAHVSMNRLRAYHPMWSRGGDIATPESQQIASDCTAWFNRLAKDAQKQRLNLIAEIETIDIEAVPAMAADLRRNGYIVQAVFVAASREESRIAMMARYEMRRAAGLAVEPPSVEKHELAFSNVVNVLGRLEFARSVDGLRVITNTGDHVYESRVEGDKWDRPPRAAATLGSMLDKTPTPKEMVRSAMRWETLFQRLGADPTVPRGVTSQVFAWRDHAVNRCEQDPTAAQGLRWAREAGAFRVMSRFEFLKEFPHHERAVEAMGLATAEAERHPPEQAQRLINHARENIAQRIERGDMARVAARQKTQPPKDRSQHAEQTKVPAARAAKDVEPPTR